MLRVLPLATAGLVAAALLAGCEPQPSTVPGTPPPTPTDEIDGVQPAGVPTDVANGFVAPWSMVRIPPSDGDGPGVTLVSQRDDSSVFLLIADPDSGDGRMTMQNIGTVADVLHGGEGGLLGLAYLDDGDTEWLYAYETTADDNRIIRIPFGDEAGLTAPPEIVLSGLARAGNHDGGRIAFGPDGMLYATVGDAANPPNAQDPASLNGKILRMTPTGKVPSDNPIDGSLVYSMGHRNPQGLAWDSDGQLWASEFGQDTWDEFNRIEPGGNYGWPVVEGINPDASAAGGFIDPWAQWPTDDASPSGLTYIDGTFFMAGLGGERLWAIYVDEDAHTASPVEWFTGEYGRIRDVVPGPDGSLWMLTNNTDGRGDPRDGDDRILQVRLTALVDADQKNG
ncbi:MAG: PQQ-dependent sugar dehydrogenase [Pseudolysinimonas sp.]